TRPRLTNFGLTGVRLTSIGLLSFDRVSVDRVSVDRVSIGLIGLARIDFSRGSRGVIACIRRWRRRRRVIGFSFCRLPGTALSLASLVGASLVGAGIVDDAVGRTIIVGRGRRRSPVC